MYSTFEIVNTRGSTRSGQFSPQKSILTDGSAFGIRLSFRKEPSSSAKRAATCRLVTTNFYATTKPVQIGVASFRGNCTEIRPTDSVIARNLREKASLFNLSNHVDGTLSIMLPILFRQINNAGRLSAATIVS